MLVANLPSYSHLHKQNGWPKSRGVQVWYLRFLPCGDDDILRGSRLVHTTCHLSKLINSLYQHPALIQPPSVVQRQNIPSRRKDCQGVSSGRVLSPPYSRAYPFSRVCQLTMLLSERNLPRFVLASLREKRRERGTRLLVLYSLQHTEAMSVSGIALFPMLCKISSLAVMS